MCIRDSGAAAPHALGVVQNVEAHLSLVVARVEDEAVRVHDGSGAEVLTVGPEHGARGGAGRAQDALRGVVEALAVFDRLHALLARLGLRVGDEERVHRAVCSLSLIHI